MAEKCQLCSFFKNKQGRGVIGVCVRFPSTLEKKPGEWCGEFVRDTRLVRVHTPKNTDQPKSAGQGMCLYCGLEDGDHTHWCPA